MKPDIIIKKCKKVGYFSNIDAELKYLGKEYDFTINKNRNIITIDCTEDMYNLLQKGFLNGLDYKVDIDDNDKLRNNDSIDAFIFDRNIIILNYHIKFKPLMKLFVILAACYINYKFFDTNIGEIFLSFLIFTFGLDENFIRKISEDEKEVLKYVYKFLKDSKKNDFDLDDIDIKEKYSNLLDILNNLVEKKILYHKPNGLYSISY